jgi:hypothetical protein
MDEILKELSELSNDITNLKCVPLDTHMETHMERVAEMLDNLVDTVASIARYIQNEEIRNM